MFEQTFVEGKTKKTWTVLVAFLAQTAFLIIAVILPMIYFDVLPKTQLTSFLVAPPPPPPPPPPPAAPAAVKIVKVIPRQFDAGRLMAPKSVPKEIATIKEEELPPPSSGVGGVVGGVPGGVAGGTPGGVLGGIIGSVPTAACLRLRLLPSRWKSRSPRSASRSAATCSRPSWSASPSRSIRRSPSRRAFRAWCTGRRHFQGRHDSGS